MGDTRRRRRKPARAYLGALAVGVFCVLPTSASASELPSTISSNTILTQAESPYSGSSTIEAGATLTVEPGVEFTSGGLVVKGTLDSKGTAEEPIVFGSSGYGGFFFKAGSGASVLDHVEVNGGGAMYGQAIKIENSSPRITNSVIRKSTWWGIYITSGAPEIDHNSITGSTQSGIIYSQEEHPGSVNIHDNVLEGNGGSAALYVGAWGETSAISLGGNIVKGNSALEAVYYAAGEAGEVPPDIGTNVLSENTGNHIDVSGVLKKSATWHNGAPINPAGLTIAKEATLSVDPGTLFEGGGIFVKGTLKAEGTAKEPIVFTRLGEYEWSGIYFEPGSGASILDHVEVDHGGTTYHQAIKIENSSPRITNSVIRNSRWWGIYITSGAPEIDHNSITGSTESGVLLNEEGGHTVTVDIHDNLFEKNGGSAALFVGIGEKATALSLGGNTVKGNSALEAVYYNGGESGAVPADIGTNVLSENVGNHINVSGVLRESGTWKDGAPINPSGLKIGKGATLTVEPGVLFVGGSISVNGALKAEGNAKEPIVFTRLGESQWGGIFFRSGSDASVLDHVEVDRGGTTYNQAIKIENSSPRITNSVIRKSTWWGIYITSGAPEIDHNSITGSTQSGIIYSQEEHPGSVNIHDNVLEGNGGSAALYVGAWGETSAISLGGNIVKGNSALEAVYYSGGEVPPDFCANDLSENTGNHINVSGTIAKSGTCGPGGYPIIGSITVAKEVIWTLEPGILFRGAGITVNGTLKAEGTYEHPVQFKPNGSGTWGGLTFNPGSSASVMEHVEVIRGGPYWGAAITINNASPTIVHSTIKSSAYYGIFIKKGGAPDIGYNRIENSVSSAIFYGEVESYSGEIDIHDNLLERNGGSAALFLGTGANVAGGTLSGNTLRENSSLEAIYFAGGEVPADLTKNRLIANKRDNINVSGTVAESGSWSDPGGPIDVSGLTVASGATLSVQPGVSFEGGQFTVEGTLKAIGTEEEPVLFGPHGSSSWSGLVFEPGSSASRLEYVEVVKGGGSFGNAVAIKGASPTIVNSTIRESSNYGIYVTTGSPTIEGNRFRSNPLAVVHEGEGKVYAPNNDWGCKGGPGSAGCDSVWNVEWKPATTLAELPRPCKAGTAQPGPGLDCLLYRYAPELRYDNQESYLANSAAEITDNWGDATELWGESESGTYTNKLLRSIGPLELEMANSQPNAGGNFHLTLGSLGTTYPDSESASEEDRLDEAGENYAEDDHKLVARGYLNRSYGRVVKGSEGKVWLQYWYFYYYNSFETGKFELNEGGLHEGDWEEIQIELDKELKPQSVVLSQHAGGASCSFEHVKGEGGERPVVYVALDSHANYPKPGEYTLISAGPIALVHDHANGKGPAIIPSVENIGENLPSWLEWPGHWGHSQAGPIPGEATSPTGPMQHLSWDPESFADDAGGCEDNYDGEDEWGEGSRAASRSLAAAPTIESVDFQGRHPSISYEIPEGGRKEAGTRLILSVKERGSDLPPLTKVVTQTEAIGEVTMPFKLKPTQDVVVLASVLDRHGHRSPVVRQVLNGS
jgi:hypothetical protein